MVIAHQVRGDLHQPGGSARVAAEPRASFISPHETILRKIFGHFAVPHGGEQEPEHAWAILADQRIEIIESLNCEAFCYRFHPHV